MRKKLKSWPIALAFVVILLLDNQTMLSDLFRRGVQWMQLYEVAHSEPGYQWRYDYSWKKDNGKTMYVYILESTESDEAGDHSVLIVLKNDQYEETDRFVMNVHHRLVFATMLGHHDSRQLELVFQKEPGRDGVQCHYLNLQNGQVIQNAGELRFLSPA